MKLTTALIASSLLLAVAAVAQSPVPVRIESKPYGMFDGMSASLQLDCELSGPVYSVIRLSGGDAGMPAFLFAGDKPAEIRLPWDKVAVVDPVVVATGFFDGAGVFEIPFEADNEAYCGNTVYFQGAQAGVSYDRLNLTAGLAVTFHDGNEQPVLTYEGPPLTSVYCVAYDWVGKPEHGVLVEVDLPFPGWTLDFERVVEVGDKMRIQYSLGPPEVVPEDFFIFLHGDSMKVRRWVELGDSVAPNLEILIGRAPVVDRIKDYALAGWIETDLPKIL